jgi:hypothetical protein
VLEPCGSENMAKFIVAHPVIGSGRPSQFVLVEAFGKTLNNTSERCTTLSEGHSGVRHPRQVSRALHRDDRDSAALRKAPAKASDRFSLFCNPAAARKFHPLRADPRFLVILPSLASEETICVCLNRFGVVPWSIWRDGGLCERSATFKRAHKFINHSRCREASIPSEEYTVRHSRRSARHRRVLHQSGDKSCARSQTAGPQQTVQLSHV